MKKKMTREERAEIKGGKYTGGPAEEKAEMKKKSKRMMDGGPVSSFAIGEPDPTAVRGAGLPRGLAKRGPGNLPPGLGNMAKLPPGLRRGAMQPMPMGTSVRSAPVAGIQPTESKVLRGGGLARKGVGMALAKGGLAKADRMSRVKTKGKMC